MQFLTEDQIRRVQAQNIDLYGGAHGLRDANLLRSAMDRAENRYHYEPGTAVPVLAAALGWGLIKNHVFIDGNKRIGLAALLLFLQLNGYDLTCSELEAQDAVLRVAASEMNESAWTAWVEQAATPRRLSDETNSD